MAKILHAANFAHRSMGKVCYNVDRKLKNGLIRAGHWVWDFSDRDVARAATIFGSRKFGILPANKRLIETADNFRPDLLLLGHADVIFNGTVSEIKKLHPHIRVAVYNVDAVAANNIKTLNAWAEVADVLFISTAGDAVRQFLRPGLEIAYFPNPVDPAIEYLRNFESQNLPWDLIYCIGGGDESDERVKLAAFLRQNSPCEMQFFGMFGQPSLWGADYTNALSKARMGLNFSRYNDMHWYSSDRIAHLVGNGLLTFTHTDTKLGKFFSDQEMVFFKDWEDLARKINHYKNNDAELRAIARQGWKKAHELFDCGRIARFVVDLSLNRKLSQEYPWAAATQKF